MTFKHVQRQITLLVALCLVWLSVNPVAMAYVLHKSQVGYHAQGAKVLYIEDWVEEKPPEVSFYDPRFPRAWFGLQGKTLLKVPAEKVFSSLPVTSAGPAKPLYKVDFTGLSREADYELRINNQPTGAHVVINDYVFWDIVQPVMQSFYLHRSGVKVSSDALDVDRPPSHIRDAYWTDVTDGETYRKDVTGGWYAGGMDYQKNTTQAAVALSYLLSAYLDDPVSFKTLKLKYPYFEYGLGELQDVLHETKFGLDWLMAMQHRDGWMVHQVDGRETIPWKTRPHEDVQTRYLTEHYRLDDAMVAATMALASRAYAKQDVGYSVKCLLSARRAWNAFEQTLAAKPLTEDELPYVALAEMELFLTTGEAAFLSPLPEQVGQIRWSHLNMQAPTLLGVYHMLSAKTNKKTALPPELSRQLQNILIPLGPTWLGSLQNRLTHYPLEHPGVYQATGANPALLYRMAQILMTRQLSPSVGSLAPLTEAMYYILGVNRFDKSFITGIGTDSVKNPAHLLSSGYTKPVPGMLVRGPYMHAGETRWSDGIRRQRGVMYLDDERDERGNYTDIVQNALTVYVLSQLNQQLNQSVPATPEAF